PAAIRRSMLAAFSAISRRIENATALRTAIQVDGLTRSWVKDRVGEGCTGHTKAAWLLSGLRQSLFVVRHGSLRSEAKFIPVKSPKNSWFLVRNYRNGIYHAAPAMGRSSTWKPSLAIWAARRLALISVERRSKWLAPRSWW